MDIQHGLLFSTEQLISEYNFLDEQITGIVNLSGPAGPSALNHWIS
ncbi:MAG: hypothetical protein BMS9Abin26_0815 [Gammaproteobacteria bacterium]|nr:MAG: hypothetical protein BMS9Abin26_0815 [Gammaproteobacteria bacterium]